MINVTVRFALHFPVVHVGPGIMENFETGCRLQALLMFPGTSQIAQRQRASLALGAAVVSVGWQLVSVWRGCGFGCPGSGHKRLPLGQGGRAAGLVSLAVDEVAF
jgi:hypothetical protein